MSKQGEENVKRYFENLGFKVNKIKESSDKTPDFVVFNKEERVFYCEEKTLEYDDFEGVKHDPTYNSISAHIHEATKQFLSVNPNHDIPNVLVFTNLDSMSDIQDLFITTTGKTMLDDGELFKMRNVGRIVYDLDQIDLYLWFDNNSFIKYVLGKSNRFGNILRQMFGF